jgi:hypothetical protein
LALAWSNKGTALLRQGKNNELNQASNAAIQLDPNVANAWITKTAALLRLNRTTEAVTASSVRAQGERRPISFRGWDESLPAAIDGCIFS